MLRLLRLVPSSAGVERLFSQLSWMKNRHQNRLSVEKLERMASIRAYTISNSARPDKKLFLQGSNKSEEQETIEINEVIA